MNHIVDAYIDFYSSGKKELTYQKNYVLIGIFSKNNILSISDGCFECPGIISKQDTIVAYKGFKVAIVSDDRNNKDIVKEFLFRYFKDTKRTEKFAVEPFNKNVMYDFSGNWEIHYNKQDKISFVCMGSETKKIKKILGFDNRVKDCEQ